MKITLYLMLIFVNLFVVLVFLTQNNITEFDIQLLNSTYVLRTSRKIPIRELFTSFEEKFKVDYLLAPSKFSRRKNFSMIMHWCNHNKSLKSYKVKNIGGMNMREK